MADGTVLIDSKLNTDGIKRGIKNLEEDLQKLAKVTSQVGEKMEKELDGAGDAAKDASRDFDTLFKANLSAGLVVDALKEVGQAAVELGKKAIESAAQINASNAQFEQTFKGLEKTARNSLNAVAKQAGMTATRMQDSYTSIFAFTKSVGADQSQALDIASRAMAAAADSAAYYDKSVEEATETLQSFLKGNYENDAALGIAATETTRNAKANELYAKSFQELSEAQKVDVLLAMVEAGNEASGALGQAAREADSWVNVMGELKEAWRLMLGALGDPLLEGLIPIVQGITGAMQELTETTTSADLNSGIDEFKESVVSLDEELKEANKTIEQNAIMAELCREKLEELEAAGLSTEKAQREYANAVAALNEIYPELNLAISEQTGLLDDNSKSQLKNLDALKQKSGYLAQEKKYNAALKEQEKAIEELHAAEKTLADTERERDTILIQLNQQTGLEAEELIRLYGSQINATAGYTDMADAAVTLTDEQMNLVQQYLILNTEADNLNQGMQDLNSSITAQDKELETMNAELDATASALGIVRTATEETTSATEELSEADQKLAQTYNDARAAAEESVRSQIGYYEELKLESDESAATIVENWNKQQEAFSNYSANLKKAVEMGFSKSLVESLANGEKESMIRLDAIVNDHTMTVEEINAAWEGMQAAREPVHDFMAAIESDLIVFADDVTAAIDETTSGAFGSMETAANSVVDTALNPTKEAAQDTGDAMGEAFETSAETAKTSWSDLAQKFNSDVTTKINSDVESIRSTANTTWTNMQGDAAKEWAELVRIVGDAIDKMQSKIDSLKGKTIDINVNKTGSGASLASYSGYDGQAYTPEAAYAAPIGIPMLATGAVIPPNAPFLAVLGDQKHGTNIEAPLETIKQAVAEVIVEHRGDTVIRFDGDLAQLGRILQPVIEEETRRIGPSLSESFISG